MRTSFPFLAGIAVALALASAQASAVTCYLKYDRNDNIVYRDVRPPVDMSENGTAARDAMRRRGEYLMFMETDDCPGVIFNYGGVSGALSVDEIVSGYRTYSGAPRGGVVRVPGDGGVSSARDARATSAKTYK
jgi:hypothetical protein